MSLALAAPGRTVPLVVFGHRHWPEAVLHPHSGHSSFWSEDRAGARSCKGRRCVSGL